VGDNQERLSETIGRAVERSDIVICTGGLGPTEDDLTRESIAAVFGEEPRVDATLEAELRAFFERRGYHMPDSNVKQAWLIPRRARSRTRAALRPAGGPSATARSSSPCPAADGDDPHVGEGSRAGAAPPLPGSVLVKRTLKTAGIGEGTSTRW